MDDNEAVAHALPWVLEKQEFSTAQLQKHLGTTPIQSRRIIRILENDGVVEQQETGSFSVTN